MRQAESVNRTLVVRYGWQLRTASPRDAGLIREFVCALSVRSQRLRFFAVAAPPSSSLVKALCGGNGGADIIVAADSSGHLIGHGMAVDGWHRGAPTTEIGLVVADSWQGRGVGTTLLRTLAGRAADRGVGTLVMEVMPENQRMLGIIGRRWPDAERERTPDSIIVRAAIINRAMHAADRPAA